MSPRYLKISTFYFFYFSILGIYSPYWSLYLQDLGYTAAEVGELLAISLVTKIFAPYIWGWIGDHTHNNLRIIRFGSALAALFFMIILLKQSYIYLVISLFLFSFFWHAVLPQVEVLTFKHLRYVSQHYSMLRMWGSVGFIVCAMGLAPVVNHFGSQVVPVLIALMLIISWLITLKMDGLWQPKRILSPIRILPLLFRTEIICLLLLCFMIQLSHGAYYAFFSIYMRENGYSDLFIGQLWALGVIAEIVIFLWMPRLLIKFGAPILLAFSLIIASLRWVLIALFPQNIVILSCAQAMHAVTFGVYHAAAIYLISLWFPGQAKGRGQALFSSISFGLGGTIGSFAAGYLWDDVGGQWVFLYAAFCALIAIPLSIPIYRAWHQCQK